MVQILDRPETAELAKGSEDFFLVSYSHSVGLSETL